MSHIPGDNPRWLSRAAILIIALSALTLFTSVALYFAGPKPFFGVWEDALMLTRYAHNLIAFGKVEWNPGGQPTYGLTSPYYFLTIVMPVATFVTHNALAIPLASSMISGLLFFVSTALMLRYLLPGRLVFRHLAMALIAISVARNANAFAVHFASGMDTLFALFFFTSYIALARWHALTLTWRSAAVSAVWGGLAFGARPDLLAFTLLIPIAWVLAARDRRANRLGLLQVVVTVLVVALQLRLAAAYFHSPLPLPFYAKSLHLYADLTGFRFTAVQHFFEFVLAYWLLFLVIVLDIAVDARAWWKDSSPLVKGLLAGVLIHMTYFLLGVTQIMPEAQRFYYPELPAIIFLAGCATVRLLGRVPESWLASLSRCPKPYGIAVCAAAVLVVPPFYVGEPMQLGSLLGRHFTSFDLTQEYRAYLSNYWFGLDRFSNLPSNLVMATTEVGHVGAMNLDKTVVDIAGLNDPLFVHQRFSADQFFAHYHPDLIYMPHPGYRAMKSSLETNPTFQRDYQYFPAETLGAETMGVALSRSSPSYEQMRNIVADVCAEKRAGSCTLTW